MEDNWVKIYATTKPYKASMVESLLENHDITYVTIDKMDSAYGFGEVEVYTPPDCAVSAIDLIKVIKNS